MDFVLAQLEAGACSDVKLGSDLGVDGSGQQEGLKDPRPAI
jgi:hypothetical protein